MRVRIFWKSNYVEYQSNDRNKTLSTKQYLDEIKPHSKDINNLKKAHTWKIQLTIAITFISSKGTDKERVIHSKSDNIESTIYDHADEVIKSLVESLFKSVLEELFQLLPNRYPIGLEISMRGGNFIFHCEYLLCYKYHEINSNCDGSNIDSPS